MNEEVAETAAKAPSFGQKEGTADLLWSLPDDPHLWQCMTQDVLSFSGSLGHDKKFAASHRTRQHTFEVSRMRAGCRRGTLFRSA